MANTPISEIDRVQPLISFVFDVGRQFVRACRRSGRERRAVNDTSIPGRRIVHLLLRVQASA